jgi:dolichol-phosphate mannosyltransferase
MNDGGQRRFGPLGSALVIIPTYNEAENIQPIVTRVRAAVPEAHILVADDNSPDGTGEVADELAAADDRVHVLHREEKEGLGAAYLAGFRWGIDHGYGVLVEMDADGSHQPEELPRLLTALKGADLVLGSRWMPGGRVVNWPRTREMISRGGSTYSRLLLGVPIRDVTGGFRAFRKETLEGLGLDEVASQGYCFQVDLARRAVDAGFHVVEVPITFTDREVGDSKMSRDIFVEALWRVTAWGVESRANRLLGRRPDRSAGSAARTASARMTGSAAPAGPPAQGGPPAESGSLPSGSSAPDAETVPGAAAEAVPEAGAVAPAGPAGSGGSPSPSAPAS